MDIGKFKARRGVLLLWLLVPPVLIVGVGLSSHALKARSEWELARTRALAGVLPRLAVERDHAKRIVAEFRGKDSTTLKTETELVSHLRNTAARVGFGINSLTVDRRVKGGAALVASVKGAGSYAAVERFLGEVTAGQHLLCESAMKLSQPMTAAAAGECRAEITFELALFGGGASTTGGR